MCEEGKLLVTSLLCMKPTLHIPLGHGNVGTNGAFMLGTVMLFVIVWYNDSEGLVAVTSRRPRNRGSILDRNFGFFFLRYLVRRGYIQGVQG